LFGGATRLHAVARVAVVAIGGGLTSAVLGIDGTAAQLLRAAVDGASDLVVANGGGSAAHPAGALIGPGTALAVVARGAVGLQRRAAFATLDVARADRVAAVRSGAGDRAGRRAHARLTGVAGGAGVGVVTLDAVGLGRLRADTGRGIADADHVALVERAAAHRRRAHASPGLAGVGGATSVAVVARAVVGFLRVRASAGQLVADARTVALAERRTHHGVGAHADPRLTGVTAGAGVQVVASRAVFHRFGLAGAGFGHARERGASVAARRAHHRRAGLAQLVASADL